jgi:hypothetical protein
MAHHIPTPAPPPQTPASQQGRRRWLSRESPPQRGAGRERNGWPRGHIKVRGGQVGGQGGGQDGGQGGGRGGAYGRRMVGLQASRPGSTCKKEKSIEMPTRGKDIVKVPIFKPSQ